MEDTEIRALVKRLARPHRSGGVVIERAAALAEGADYEAIVHWIVAHDGAPEAVAAPTTRRGLHASRVTESVVARSQQPQRYILPASAVN